MMYSKRSEIMWIWVRTVEWVCHTRFLFFLLIFGCFVAKKSLWLQSSRSGCLLLAQTKKVRKLCIYTNFTLQITFWYFKNDIFSINIFRYSLSFILINRTLKLFIRFGCKCTQKSSPECHHKWAIFGAYPRVSARLKPGIGIFIELVALHSGWVT